VERWHLPPESLFVVPADSSGGWVWKVKLSLRITRNGCLREVVQCEAIDYESVLFGPLPCGRTDSK
jgi:hypothetical protein